MNELILASITGIDNREGVPTAYNAGTGIIPAFRGQGIVGEMYEMLLPRLKAMGIRQSILEVICQNERAIKAYEKAGFQHEGRKRQADFQEGRYVDMLLMSVLRPEWHP